MLAAGGQVVHWHRVLTKTGDNVVGELLKNQGTFYEWNHYSKGDIYASETHGQYFYHAHAKGNRPGEHGHFHTFLRSKGMPPVPYDSDVEWPSGDDSLSHLTGIAMGKKSVPAALFSVNRWVTGETWYPAGDVTRMIGLFEIDHARPSWPINRWATAMLRLFHPQIIDLVGQRDEAVEKWRRKHPDRDVYEDREFELTSHLKISVDKQIATSRSALGQP